jgi:hypothetical protein
MSTTNARRYAAGAALSFGVVLIEVLVIRFALSGLTSDQITAMDAEIFAFFIVAHVFAGAVGGYLVARRIQSSYLKTGITVSLIAYLFELVYNEIVLGVVTNVYLLIALLVGATAGAAIYQMTHGEKL